MWIEKQRTSYMWEAIRMIISRDDVDQNGEISWDEYRTAHFGRWEGDAKIDKVNIISVFIRLQNMNTLLEMPVQNVFYKSSIYVFTSSLIYSFIFLSLTYKVDFPNNLNRATSRTIYKLKCNFFGLYT